MQINKQPAENHTIQSYSESGIRVNSIDYTSNVLITPDKIITEWPVKTLQELNLALLDHQDLEVIIIGHNQPGIQPPISLLQELSKKRTGLECMSIGAACRTFNVLLSEDRIAALGIIF